METKNYFFYLRIFICKTFGEGEVRQILDSTGPLLKYVILPPKFLGTVSLTVDGLGTVHAMSWLLFHMETVHISRGGFQE